MLSSYLLSLFLFQFSASNTGELRVTVNDATGLPVQSTVEVSSQANQVRRALQTDVQGQLVARQLPFGTYEVRVSREGFAPFSGLVDVRSATPTMFTVTLALGAIQSQVNVTAGETLVD